MQISKDKADCAAKAACEKADELGIAVSVVVLDAGANMKTFSRMDGAWLGSIDVRRQEGPNLCTLRKRDAGGLGGIQARGSGPRT